ncbi:MAG: hypothetical protein SVU32_09095 [Candidatus Nanohaloarchaea archaeon]|nr:hypothetical protein [Candidatus Nanohaloarchaea archaeon]
MNPIPMHAETRNRYDALDPDGKHEYNRAWDSGIHETRESQDDYGGYQSSRHSDVVEVYQEMLDNPFVDDALAELLETRVNDLLDR